jgi:hypothetical protein
MDRQLSGGLAIDGEDLVVLSEAAGSDQGATQRRETLMMRRFCGYLEKVFDFGKQIHTLRDTRLCPRIPTVAIWGSVFFLFVMRHRSLNGMEQDLREPKRVERLIGKIKPSADRMGDVLGMMAPDELRAMLSRVNHRLKRNKALRSRWPFRVAVLDGHEFFSQPSSVLSSVLRAQGDGQGGGGNRVLSSRRDMPSGGIPDRHASGCGDDPPWGRGGDGGQAGLGARLAP